MKITLKSAEFMGLMKLGAEFPTCEKGYCIDPAGYLNALKSIIGESAVERAKKEDLVYVCVDWSL